MYNEPSNSNDRGLRTRRGRRHKLKRVKNEHAIAFTVAIVFMILVVVFSQLLVHQLRRNQVSEAKHFAELQLQVVQERLRTSLLTQELFLRLFAENVSDYLEWHDEISIAQLSDYPAQLTRYLESFSVLALSKAGIVSDVYPKYPNISAIGTSLTDMTWFSHVVDDLNSGNPVFIGPYRSPQGNLTVGSHAQIKQKAADGDSVWGYASLGCDFKKLLEFTGATALVDTYTIAVRALHPDATNSVVFGDSWIFSHEAIVKNFSYSHLDWSIAILPHHGWPQWTDSMIAIASFGVLLAVLVSLVGYWGSLYILSIRRRAFSDGMTGVLNKTEFIKVLRAETRLCSRNHTRFALALLDIDDFKHVNDVYGHLEGDRALLTLVNRISQTVRSDDMVCRFGGDEFIILFKHMEHDAAPRMAASRVFNTIGTLTMTIGLQTVQIKTSMGVAVYGIDGTDPDTLLKKADTLLYQAKEHGKNKLVFSR